MTEVEKILQDRGNQYGDFWYNSIFIQDLKFMFRQQKNWNALSSNKKEALDMIATKIGRILAGDLAQQDSWLDIAGYAKLVANLIEKEKK